MSKLNLLNVEKYQNAKLNFGIKFNYKKKTIKFCSFSKFSVIYEIKIKCYKIKVKF